MRGQIIDSVHIFLVFLRVFLLLVLPLISLVVLIGTLFLYIYI